MSDTKRIVISSGKRKLNGKLTKMQQVVYHTKVNKKGKLTSVTKHEVAR